MAVRQGRGNLVTIRGRGFTATRKMLNQLPWRLQRSVMEKTTRESAKLYVSPLKQAMPRRDKRKGRSGRTRTSITVKTKGKGRGVKRTFYAAVGARNSFGSTKKNPQGGRKFRPGALQAAKHNPASTFHLYAGQGPVKPHRIGASRISDGKRMPVVFDGGRQVTFTRKPIRHPGYTRSGALNRVYANQRRGVQVKFSSLFRKRMMAEIKKFNLKQLDKARR